MTFTRRDFHKEGGRGGRETVRHFKHRRNWMYKIKLTRSSIHWHLFLWLDKKCNLARDFLVIQIIWPKFINLACFGCVEAQNTLYIWYDVIILLPCHFHLVAISIVVMVYRATSLRGLAIAQMVIGALMTVFGVACIFFAQHWSSYPAGTGVWVGLWVSLLCCFECRLYTFIYFIYARNSQCSCRANIFEKIS